MNSTTTSAASIHKVRRDVRGGKRGDGHRRHERIRRADPTRIHPGRPDATLTGVAGLASFGTFCRKEGVDAELARRFFRLKAGRLVVYPMEAQLRLLLDANVAGEARVFGLESLAADPLFVRLAGGVVPSIDTVYRDLTRFDQYAIQDLEQMMVRFGLPRQGLPSELHVDVDPTVAAVYGSQQGAAVGGANARLRGLASYHPILAYCPELDACVGARLRPGDTALGNDDGPTIVSWLRRLREHVGAAVQITLRIDAAGDCIGILGPAHKHGFRFIAKAQLTSNLAAKIERRRRWTTTDVDADGKPTRQVAEIDFDREPWIEKGYRFRVIAVRVRDSDYGKQSTLWDLGWSVQAYITNDEHADAEQIAHEYNARAEIEPIIAELKNGWGIGKVPSQVFAANHALFLVKLLAHNLMRRFVRWVAPELAQWRTPWLRRTLMLIPGRLTRSGRQWSLRTPPRSRIRLE